MTPPPRLGVIACRVFEEELAKHGADAPHIQGVRFFEIGLHDRPDGLRESLAGAIREFDQRTDIEAIVLVYALCGCGTAGLRAGRLPLVIARAHDCMTLFLGSKEAYAARQSDAPDTFYFTPGWMRAGRSPGPRRLEILREEFARRFDPEDVEFLLESEKAQWQQHGRAAFLHLETPSAERDAREAAATAAELGWQFDKPACDPSLLRDLLAGRWDDERFAVVPPGGVLRHRADAGIFGVIREEKDSPKSGPQTRDPH